MSTPGQLLSSLRQSLELRTERIKRAAYLTKITFGPVQDQFFSAKVWWDGGELIKRFEYSQYFTSSKLIKTPCQVSRQLIQEILNHRGL